MSKVIVVDTENTMDLRVLPTLDLKEDDLLVFFKSVNSKPIGLDALEYINRLNLQIKFINCEVGFSNAMDFKIIAFISSFVTTNPKGYDLYILSDDGCYSKVLKDLSSFVNHSNNIVYITSSTATSMMNKFLEDKTLNKIIAKYKAISTKILGFKTLGEVHSYLDIKEKDRLVNSKLHNHLVALFKEGGKIIYKDIKDFYMSIPEVIEEATPVVKDVTPVVEDVTSIIEDITSVITLPIPNDKQEKVVPHSLDVVQIDFGLV